MTMAQMENGVREIEVRSGLSYPLGGSPGYFHGWCKEPFFYNDDGSCLPRTFALVEFPDGNVRFIEPNWIRFKNPMAPKND